MRRVALIALLLLAGACGAPARAADAEGWTQADRNGDGTIDRREAERRALDLFSFVDNNKDAYLSRDEYNALVLEGSSFAAVDTNHDGKISTHEFVAMRYREFDAADKDHDGVLSAAEQGAAPAADAAAPPPAKP
jgi:Ca2+-binding EF-hand superfamily protein